MRTKKNTASKSAKKVKIVEVGLRDGLQNESSQLSVEQRYDLYEKLVQAGSQNIEIGAFVSPKWVPQMAVTPQLTSMIISESSYADPNNSKFKKNKLKTNKKTKQKSDVHHSVLVPNEQGMLQAIEAGVKEVAIFGACSESFSLKNINCTIAESFKRFKAVMKLAREHNVKVRGYLSTCFYCPFEGHIPEKKVIAIAKKMYQLGVYEISIGDTIGAAQPAQVESLFKNLKKVIPAAKLAGHFHDTRGQALANILAAYHVGIRTFDASIAGLGGCPYAPGAAGNVATEDVVYMFDGMNVNTGLNIERLIEAHRWLQPLMDHPLSSKVGRVGLLHPLGKVKRIN
ncbi:hydroxymethylglutaryl-CoA lyase [Pseudobdellovibrio exovorus]|uniref:Hydroxymethylglutaryl-CoA lyase n=1 Tax=Pseudobdellovibrio exovorus JSS TaxID=1184267 RepID=M4VEP2_9BACT|nr:hydroxymethylglutaryl-CoA lyase [Pseudobdellovibrio exovorus]AGH96486.1 hydroxymethylglutaryl-CoA lyase [Pseudobdellovibrio exovorus JSS]